jgi:hypothetical protein
VHLSCFLCRFVDCFCFSFINYDIVENQTIKERRIKMFVRSRLHLLVDRFDHFQFELKHLVVLSAQKLFDSGCTLSP